MKCIQAIKQTKENSIGDILRVDDKTAFNMVGSTWKYVSKSEWKSKNNSHVEEDNKRSDNKKKNK